MQHLLVLLLVGICAAYALWGAMQTLFGKRSRVGSCCARGCGAAQLSTRRQADSHIIFLPVDFLRHRRS